MAATIGALRVVLGADTAAFHKGISGAQSKLSSFSKVAGAGLAAVGVAITGALVGVGAAIRQTLDQADELSKVSQQIGVPVDELTRLKHAADLSGVSFEQLTGSMGKLSRSMAEAAASGVGRAAEAFTALNIEVKNSDGTLRGSSEVLTDLSARFASMKDGATKTALAMDIFGRSGAQLIPLLNSGAGGLAAMKAEADKLGIVLDADTAKAAERFNDSLEKLGKVWDGVVVQLTTAVAPALADLADTLAAVAIDQGFAEKTGKALGTSITDLSGSVENLARNLDSLILTYRAFSAISSILQAGILPTAANVQGAIDSIQTFRTKLDETNAAAVVTGSALTQLNNGFANLGAALTVNTAPFEPIIANQDALAAAQRESAAAARDVAAAMSEGMGIYEQTRTAAEALALEQIKLRQYLDQGAITWDEYARAGQMAAERVGATWGQASESIAGSFASIGKSFGKESSKMAKAGQVFGIAQATISALTGAAKALELPFPANLAAMASVLATGLGIVANIKSQKVPGFAHGGTFKVGGVAGIDNNLIAVSRGEMVDIKTPGQQVGSGERFRVEIPGFSDDHWYKGDNLRKLIHSINGAIDNGTHFGSQRRRFT